MARGKSRPKPRARKALDFDDSDDDPKKGKAVKMSVIKETAEGDSD